MPTDLFLAQSPPANLQPVQFDFGAASAAAAALRHAADVVDSGARSRVGDARNAESAWTGNQRANFDRIETALGSEASELVRKLRAAADKLNDQAAAARRENAHRALELRHWQQRLDKARQDFIDARNQLTRKG